MEYSFNWIFQILKAPLFHVAVRSALYRGYYHIHDIKMIQIISNIVIDLLNYDNKFYLHRSIDWTCTLVKHDISLVIQTRMSTVYPRNIRYMWKTKTLLDTVVCIDILKYHISVFTYLRSYKFIWYFSALDVIPFIWHINR